MTPRITLAEQDGVDTFEKEVSQLLGALGHPEAMVTDESQIRDFLVWGVPSDDPDNMEKLAAVSALMGRPVQRQDVLWELGRELRALQTTSTVH